MEKNILIALLRRIDAAGGALKWTAPGDEDQWRLESGLLMAGKELKPPLVRMEHILLTGIDEKPLGLLKSATVILLEAGKTVLQDNAEI